MKRMIRACAALAAGLTLATIAMAQNARVTGQVLDRDGKPWVGITVVLKSEDGRSFTLKTDKDGKFGQILPAGGIYTFILTNAATGLNYSEKRQLTNDEENNVVINFKTIMAEQAAANPEQQKQQQEATTKFKEMQAHFTAGRAALDDYDASRKQLSAAPADQKGPLQDKMKTDAQTAVTELEQAEQGVQAKDVKNHAVVWASLAQAYDHANRFDDSANAYQKAIDLQPSVGYYMNQSTVLASIAVAQTDPKVMQQKLADASADCEKAAVLDPTPGGAKVCWKNIGIVLSNKGDLKDAIPPLEKATQADPKDAQSWFLLGSAYTGTIDSKQEGDKMTYIIPPGTGDAYQKCVDADPTGPYAAQCKSMIDTLATMAGGVSTTVGARRKKK
ncbi:MAG TPA: hypothetical protein VJO53_08525 [Candidatus Acidoferrales bacterium]|nr:hypothetical protein [Candidatus Acidoferrales bacterium]